MRTSSFWIAACALVSAFLVRAEDASNVTQTIVDNAVADSINVQAVPNVDSILAEINLVYESANLTDPTSRKRASSRLFQRGLTNIADVHAHCIADWFRQLVPTTGGSPTPQWNVSAALNFMAGEGISRQVIAFSAPGANVYPGNQILTIALARLINEQTAAYARSNPDKFAFYAVVPLPYTQAAITEATYALDVLGAAGIVLFSNFEGRYLGDAAFTPFFKAMNARGAGQLVYVHPSTPYLKVNGQLVEANPTVYPTGFIEFFFETARTLEDLTISQTIHNFTNINYIIPHVGGAFPSVADRFLKSYPALYDASLKIFQTRFFWDSAGPTYYHQVGGLLAYGIPTSQLLFGTDFPYAPIFTYGPSLAAVQSTNFITDAQKTALFSTNAQRLFGKRLPSG